MSNQGTTLEKLQLIETLCHQGYASDILEVHFRQNYRQ